MQSSTKKASIFMLTDDILTYINATDKGDVHNRVYDLIVSMAKRLNGTITATDIQIPNVVIRKLANATPVHIFNATMKDSSRLGDHNQTISTLKLPPIKLSAEQARLSELQFKIRNMVKASKYGSYFEINTQHNLDEPVPDEPDLDEPNRAEPDRAEPGQDELVQDEPIQDDQDEPDRAEPIQDEPDPAEPIQDEQPSMQTDLDELVLQLDREELVLQLDQQELVLQPGIQEHITKQMPAEPQGMQLDLGTLVKRTQLYKYGQLEQLLLANGYAKFNLIPRDQIFYNTGRNIYELRCKLGELITEYVSTNPDYLDDDDKLAVLRQYVLDFNFTRCEGGELYYFLNYFPNDDCTKLMQNNDIDIKTSMETRTYFQKIVKLQSTYCKKQ